MAKFLAMFVLLLQLISFNVFGEELESLHKPALLNKPTPLHPPANAPLHHHHNRNLSPTSAHTPLHPSHHAKPPTHHHHQHPPAHAPLHHHHPPAHAPIYHHQHLHPAKPPTHHHHQHPPAHAPLHHPHPPAHSPIYHHQHLHPAKPPTHHHHQHPPTHAPVHHHQPLHPVKPPTYHHHQHPPAHAPVQPPTHHHHRHPPARAPVHQQHPPAHAPVQPPTRHHYHNNPPSHAPVHKPTPIHPPFRVPIPIKSRIAVEGVVYVKSCKHARVDTLLNATSLKGAIVKLQCNNTNHKVVRKGKTDKNGYFYIKGSKDISSFEAHKCNVVLDSAPNGLKPSNIHGGITGAVLKRKKSFVSKGHVLMLYNVKPLAFEPKCTH